MTDDPEHAWRPGWDVAGVAEAIEQYWLDDPHEAAHRDTLVDLTVHHLESPRASVLEVGCGTGLVYGRLVPTHLANGRYVGIDIAEPMLRLARRKHGPARLVHGDGYTLPFDDGAFDVTLCFEVRSGAGRAISLTAEREIWFVYRR